MQVQQLYMADCLQIVEDEVVLQSKEDVDVSQGELGMGTVCKCAVGLTWL
jgi:hypothetical protein